MTQLSIPRTDPSGREKAAKYLLTAANSTKESRARPHWQCGTAERLGCRNAAQP